MPPKGKTPLNLNIDAKLLGRVEKFRHKKMFATRTEAIEFLLDAALTLNPDRRKIDLSRATVKVW